MIYSKKEKFDLAACKDPLALQIPWTPLIRGGSSVAFRSVVRDSQDILRVTRHWYITYFAAMLVTVGVACIWGAYRAFSMGSIAGGGILVGIPIGLPIAAYFIIAGYSRPDFFDKEKGLYWQGLKSDPLDPDQATKRCRLEEICALQIIEEWCISDHRSKNTRVYKSFELNLILKDGRRLNVMDHNGLKSIRRDARKIADFLSVPIWDAANKQIILKDGHRSHSVDQDRSPSLVVKLIIFSVVLVAVIIGAWIYITSLY